MSARFTQQEIGKLIVIAVIIAATIGVLVYIGQSFVSAVRQSNAKTEISAADCAVISSPRAGGNPSHCPPSTVTAPMK
ncbi:hypothetical protein [Acetobacter sp. DsW_063]|uniref:hypothetical protein n=1 Tax=Acetobacter sp. DsW_063 TaxID=1514894 RepID=UPI000A385B95|nr:hypothetical protein [Acetobacter sp. DsW_063]OUJ15093.1 hypothetical protein HK28_10240 [Acetobacter sp. DsW_063]